MNDCAKGVVTGTDQKVAALVDVCAALSDGETERAGAILTSRYPFKSVEKTARKFTIRQALRIFSRDGFIDRYSGERLICPPALRLISIRLPEQFPFHSNWRYDACHFAFWELFPTLDHIIPVTRGGADEESNLVTTSMALNAVKANWTLDQLRWSLHPRGDMAEWDGLLRWFMQQMETNPDLSAVSYLRNWHARVREYVAKLPSALRQPGE